MKAKKDRILERLEIGKKMRIEFGEEFEAVQAEIEAEKQTIRDLKAQLVDGGLKAVAKVRRARLDETRKFKKEIRAELRAEARRRLLELQKVRDMAEKLREQPRNHVMTRGDKYKAKVEITQTTFLAALSDEEMVDLIAKQAARDKQRIEEEIEAHRSLKSQKMDELLRMLNEVTKVRDAKEEEHMRKRHEKREEEVRVRLQKEAHEEEQLLSLERKLEKKRKMRIVEAEEMDERTRQIAARNRFLALNKRAVSVRVFQSQQEASLRSAKDRQQDRKRPQAVTVSPTRKRRSQGLPNLETLLGL
jgi:hypothetical protein